MQLEGDSAFLDAFSSSSSGAAVVAMHASGPLSVGLKLVQTEGFQALFSGVSATILRQTLYSTTRMGLYEMLKQQWREPTVRGGLPIFKKIAAGLIAGGIGAAIGNPADVAMVRMQADGLLPPDQRRNYKDVVDALARMVKQEGIRSLWTGSYLTIQRAMIVTACQLATYDQVKESFISSNLFRDGLAVYLIASCFAGFVAAVASNPIDVVKTRIMNMKIEPGQSRPYDGAMDCVLKTVKAEGVLALYKGFLPTVARHGPFTVVLFMTLEQIRRVLKDL